MINIIPTVSATLTLSVSICYFIQKYLIPDNNTLFCSINDFLGVIFKKNLNRPSESGFGQRIYFSALRFCNLSFTNKKAARKIQAAKFSSICFII